MTSSSQIEWVGVLLVSFFNTKLSLPFSSPVAVFYPFIIFTYSTTLNIPMSSTLSCPTGHQFLTFLFQCSSFPVLCLFIHFPNETSLLLHPDTQSFLLPFSVWKTWDVFGDLQILSPLEKQTQSISNQMSKLRGNFRKGAEGDFSLVTQPDSPGTCIYKFRAPKHSALSLTVTVGLFFYHLPPASSLKVFILGAGTLPGFLGDYLHCRISKKSESK